MNIRFIQQRRVLHNELSLDKELTLFYWIMWAALVQRAD